MNKKNLILIAVALVLAGVYAVYFTDWFKPKIIKISHTSRAMRFARRPGQKDNSATMPIAFGFDQEYRFSEIKVVPVAALQTNDEARPIWHLVSDSNSVPVKFFLYGQRLQGMKLAVAGMRPEPLEPGVTYRLFVKSGSAKGQHDFQPAANPAAQASQ
jgi:hypothetical protein